jgi:hypothetical protein
MISSPLSTDAYSGVFVWFGSLQCENQWWFATKFQKSPYLHLLLHIYVFMYYFGPNQNEQLKGNLGSRKPPMVVGNENV